MIIIKNYINLFSISLKIHVFYNEKKKVPILSTFSNCTTLTLSILEPNNDAYDKFVITVAKNKAAYLVTAKVE